MATTIRSTDLDFENIKISLKEHLLRQAEFADYNFEASALSNLLDVLAYNTHHNALLANFALNESFLSTAQLRSSLVGLAGGLGYTVNSRTAAFAVVNMYVTDINAPSSLTLPAGFTFSTTVDNKTFTFQTRDTLIATNNGSNQYFFSLNSNINVPIYEGTSKRKTFIAGVLGENDSYVIPVTNLDLETVSVTVYDTPSASVGKVYTNINNATTINENSRIFVCKETPNGFYELTFGNGVRLGITPNAGNKIEVTYTTVNGSDANGARTFTPDGLVGGKTLNVTTVSASGGGNDREAIESIRKNAPYLYAAQNRMVTADDYAALTLRNFKNVISDIKAWGGEDNVPASYGSVFLSIVFSNDDATVQANTKTAITNLAKDLSVASFDIQFSDPIETYLEISTVFQFNPNLTSLTQTEVENAVKSTMITYFEDNLGGFDKSFRRSRMLTDIDAVDGSVLSSRAEVKMQNRFNPSSGTINYIIPYPAAIASPDDVYYIIESENFYLNGRVCYLRNKLGTNIMQAINVGTGLPEVDNIGFYNANAGTITLQSFAGTLISGESIKISATPGNQSVINPLRSNILLFDDTASSAIAVLTDTI
jgi:hypothetical protein